MDITWKELFRETMKEKHITYAQLAQSLQMSLPGVKKIFQKNDIGLERFGRICQILGLEPADIVKQSYTTGYKIRKLPKAADLYLAKDKIAFFSSGISSWIV